MNLHTPTPDLLRLEGLVVTKVDDTSYNDEIFIYAKGTYEKGRCPYCDVPPNAVHGHGTEEQKFRDSPIWGKKVSLLIDRRRFRCMICRKTWFEPATSLHTRRLMTARMAEYVVKRCFTGTNIAVARDLGVDEGTVRNVFKDYLAEMKHSVRFETPEILGIDEIHLAGPRCVLTNIGQHTLFDFLPSRTTDKLIPYFQALPDKRNVKLVVADMHRPYHRIADRFFPERPVIVDKFHVVRMANKGLDNVRKKVGRNRTKEERIRLKDERFLLYQRRSELNSEEIERVDEWRRAFPLIKEAYRIKEAFFDAFDEDNRKSGERAFDRCLQSIHSSMDPYFQEMITACGNWRPRILNYFDFRVTNAYTESMNSLIREVDRLGRGYSFEIMRARMLYNKEARLKKTSTRSRRPGHPDDATFFSSLPMDSVDEDARVVEYGPDIDSIVEMLKRDAEMRKMENNGIL